MSSAPTPAARPPRGGSRSRRSPTSCARPTSARSGSTSWARSSATARSAKALRRGRPLSRDRNPADPARRHARLPVEPSNGGRAGLEPAQAWFEVVKWQALAAKQVARELRHLDDLVVGLDVVHGQEGSGLRKARLRLALGAASVALQRAGRRRPGLELVADGRPAASSPPARSASSARPDLASLDLAARGADRRSGHRVHRGLCAHGRVAARHP